MGHGKDTDRFDTIYKRHGPSVLRYCVYSTGSRQDGEDIAAEVFARYIERGARVDEERLLGWLFAVARNLCATHFRRAARGRRAGERLAATADPARGAGAGIGGGAGADEAWRDAAVFAHVRALDEHARLVLFLRVVEDRPFAEVARIVSKKEGAVKMTYYRAIERLRKSMRPTVEGAPARPARPARPAGPAPAEGARDA